MASRPFAILTAFITTAVALTIAAPASAAITCDTATSGGSTFYDGPSASYKYDARFSNSASIPNLSTHTPQGAGTWYNWDGSGKNLVLIASYRDAADSQIYGIDPSTGPPSEWSPSPSHTSAASPSARAGPSCPAKAAASASTA
jgi:opacity protein-like surface antigen